MTRIAPGGRAVPRPRGRRRLELRPEELRRRLDPARLHFASTADVVPLVGTVGQPRALAALDYGLEVTTHGFNIFVAGLPGSGRLSTVLDFLRGRADAMSAPDDWVYVHDFANPDRPQALRLPAGQGAALGRAMDEFVEAARREITRLFESEEYERRQRQVVSEIAEERKQLEEELTRYAAARGFALEMTLTGIITLPLVDGHPVTRERFEQLPPDQRTAMAAAGAEIEEQTAATIRHLHQLEKETVRRIQALDREIALFATEPLFRDLEERYAAEPRVLAHLENVMTEILEHLADFRADEPSPLPFPAARRTEDGARYRVNVLVDNAGSSAAPIVVESNPTYYNLLGRIEYRAAFGAMVTDFREIKPGALHRANGGFLVVDLVDVLRHPFAWEGLKRALSTGESRIENLAEEYSPLPSASLRPEPIPLDVKVVLLGSPLHYQLLFDLDDDFRELFKVKAEFSPDLAWSAEHHRNYAAFVSRWVRDNGLLHFDRPAVAAIIEHGARLREDQRKLTARLIEISDLVSEASFWAAKRGHRLVEPKDVERAIRQKEYRSNLLEERVRELIHDGVIVIAIDGAAVGRVNGISILDLGDHSFGRPCRVSARVALGRGRVESIEREIELSGPIHSKGVMTVASYVAATYAQEWPLSASATLTFEQSYDEVEGDSASSAELYALLSALADVPLRQGIAVTGSVDQHGEIHAVGGVTRKIEGFYATCKAAGLTGDQGVVIPTANVRNLMLDPEIVEAVRAGTFHVWAIRTVDEGIALLTGRTAGRRAADGSYPPDSVHGLAAARLVGYAARLQELTTAADD